VDTPDQLLTITEAAALLKTTKDWLYRHWDELPFTVRLSPRQLRFSAKSIERYIEERQHAGTHMQAG
jgi:predicted DNA-binding transcriptional regulator AlpA